MKPSRLQGARQTTRLELCEAGRVVGIFSVLMHEPLKPLSLPPLECSSVVQANFVVEINQLFIKCPKAGPISNLIVHSLSSHANALGSCIRHVAQQLPRISQNHAFFFPSSTIIASLSPIPPAQVTSPHFILRPAPLLTARSPFVKTGRFHHEWGARGRAASFRWGQDLHQLGSVEARPLTPSCWRCS